MFRRFVIACGGFAALSFAGIPGARAEEACPSPTDTHYIVRPLDSLWEIAKSAYGLDSPSDFAALKEVASSLYRHNLSRVGMNHNQIYVGSVLCLPDVVETPFRKVTMRDAKGAGEPIKKEGETLVDVDLGEPARDVGVVSSLPGGESPPASRPGPDAPDEASRTPPPQPSTARGRFAIEVTGGVLTPFTQRAWEGLYRVSGLMGLGARARVAGLELTPRLLLVGGWHPTTFNGIEQEQELLGAGGSIQVGVPIAAGSFRFTPGAEAALLYLRRTIERRDYPFEGTPETQAWSAPLMGAYLRLDYVFRPKQPVTVGVEVSSDLLLMNVLDLSWRDNFNAKMLGGVSYAL